MKTIYKYRLALHADGPQLFQLPDGATVLSVGICPLGQLAMWIYVDMSKACTQREFVVVGTGHPVPDGLEFIGTVVSDPFVWHILEIVGVP